MALCFSLPCSILETLHDKIYQKLFTIAEIAKFNKERAMYEDNLKYYRDFKNAIDYAFFEGKQEGLQEGLLKGKQEVYRKVKEKDY